MKWYSYILCFILIMVGAFSGIQLYKEIKAESYVNGSIDISNEFSKESFSYSATSAVFYHDIYDDTNTYTFDKELLKVNDYNGRTKTYELWLNDFILLDTTFNAGSVYSTVKMDFYNEYGDLVNNSVMNLSIKFLSNKTTLTLSTTGEENALFLEQYFSDNGIRLELIEVL